MSEEEKTNAENEKNHRVNRHDCRQTIGGGHRAIHGGLSDNCDTQSKWEQKISIHRESNLTEVLVDLQVIPS